MHSVGADELHKILECRVVIARAAQRDSLSWWEDEALTPGADLLLRRLFPRTATRAAWKLALLSARARHESVLADWPEACHLFDFGAEVEGRFDEVIQEPDSINVPQDPIRSRGELAMILRAIAPEPTTFSEQLPESSRVARLGNEVASLPVVDRAVALAWAYVTPDAAGLVVPFYLPISKGE